MKGKSLLAARRDRKFEATRARNVALEVHSSNFRSTDSRLLFFFSLCFLVAEASSVSRSILESLKKMNRANTIIYFRLDMPSLEP